MRTAAALVAAVLVLAGCGRSPGTGPPAARVGTSVLTLDNVTALRDSGVSDPAHLRAYVDQWVADELLYREAERRGLTEDPSLLARMDAVRRRLAVEALLAAELYTRDTATVNEDAIRALYASGGTAFLLREPVARVSFALFADRDAANAFRTRLLRGDPWPSAVTAARTDTLLGGQLLRVVTREFFTPSTLYPEELWKLARTLQTEEASFAVRTDAGYYVLVVHSYRDQGQMPELDYVRADLRDRLLIEHRRRRYEDLLAGLRAGTTVDIRTDLLDSIAAPPEERP